MSHTDADFFCREWAFQSASLILFAAVSSWPRVLFILVKLPWFLNCIRLVGYLFRRVIQNEIWLSFDIISCVFPLLEIRFPVGLKPGWVGLGGNCSHCLTQHKLFKFAPFHESCLNFITSLRRRRAEICRFSYRRDNPARIPRVRNIYYSFASHNTNTITTRRYRSVHFGVVVWINCECGGIVRKSPKVCYVYERVAVL